MPPAFIPLIGHISVQFPDHYKQLLYLLANDLDKQIKGIDSLQKGEPKILGQMLTDLKAELAQVDSEAPPERLFQN